MLSSILKQIMTAASMQQTDLADLLGVSIDRIKGLTSGRTKKLTREEADALVTKLHVRGDFLATGEGPIFQSESEREFYRRMEAVKTATAMAAHAPPGRVADFQALLFQMETNPRLLKLIQNYMECSEEDRRALEKIALLHAEAEHKEVKPIRKRNNGGSK